MLWWLHAYRRWQQQTTKPHSKTYPRRRSGSQRQVPLKPAVPQLGHLPYRRSTNISKVTRSLDSVRQLWLCVLTVELTWSRTKSTPLCQQTVSLASFRSTTRKNDTNPDGDEEHHSCTELDSHANMPVLGRHHCFVLARQCQFGHTHQTMNPNKCLSLTLHCTTNVPIQELTSMSWLS